MANPEELSPDHDHGGEQLSSPELRYGPSGKLRSETFTTPEGVTTRRDYYESGVLSGEVTLHQYDITSKTYYESGQLREERVGPSGGFETIKIYYESGQLQEEIIKHSGGFETSKTYYESGELEEYKLTTPDTKLNEYRYYEYDQNGNLLIDP